MKPTYFPYIYSYWIRRVGVNVLSVNGVPRRTNNNIESFHNTLKYQFSVTHPNLWAFLGKYITFNINNTFINLFLVNLTM